MIDCRFAVHSRFIVAGGPPGAVQAPQSGAFARLLRGSLDQSLFAAADGASAEKSGEGEKGCFYTKP